jgi:TRAP-type C4-dicarboxylate transport system permease small subunit
MTEASRPGAAPAGGDLPLIVADDPEVRIEHHPEDWLSFVIFWAMAGVVFLQFFTRYVLNDSIAWTEEIARYLLMWVTFTGAAVAMRRRTHIAVEVLLHFLPPPAVRVLRFLIDAAMVGFVAFLCWSGILITERMQIQTMTVIEWPMSIVYGGIAVGCFLMLWRAVEAFVRDMRRGWRPDPAQHGLVID